MSHAQPISTFGILEKTHLLINSHQFAWNCNESRGRLWEGESWDRAFIHPKPPSFTDSLSLTFYTYNLQPPHNSPNDLMKNVSDPGHLPLLPASNTSVAFWYLRVTLKILPLTLRLHEIWALLVSGPTMSPVLATSFCLGDFAHAVPSTWNAFFFSPHPLACPLLPTSHVLEVTVYLLFQLSTHIHPLPSLGYTLSMSSVSVPWLDCKHHEGRIMSLLSVVLFPVPGMC